MAIIEIENLGYSYPGGLPALIGVNLVVESNESIAIAGQNGAGKSTLLKNIMGLLRPSEGRVCLFGEDIVRITTAQIARKAGFVAQNPRHQIFLSTVMAEVSFGPRRLGMPAEEIQARSREALRVTGLEGREETHPYDLNPAERKLLTIASAVSMDPQILILDEPTGGLDHASVERVLHVIRAYLEDGRTVITVTHDMDLVATCANRMLVMHQGQVIASGDKRQVLSQTDLLADAHIETTAISRLASACNLPASVLTVKEMVETIVKNRG